MLNLMLNPTVSCYLNHNGYIHNNDGSPLLINKFRNYQGYFSYELCVTLNTAEIDLASLRLQHAVLRLPIQKFSSSFFCSENRLAVCARSYSNQGTANLVTTLTQPINRSSITYNCIQLDLIDLFLEWKYKEYPVMEVYLSLTAPNLILQIWNEPSLSTELILECTRLPEIPPIPEPKTPGMLSISSKKNSSSLIEPNEIIHFDTIDHGIMNGIHYNMNQNTFSFEQAGYYYIEWVINLRGSISTECLCIGIRNESTGEIFEFHVPNTAPLEVCGQHILHIIDPSENYSLINACDTPVQLSYAHTQATMIIFRI